jgi:hypothetical protein
MAYNKRNKDGRLSIRSLEGKTIAKFAIHKYLDVRSIAALDDKGKVLFYFSDWNLMDSSGMFFTTAYVRKEHKP